MYYLIVRNLGVEKCIDRSEDDVYENGMSFNCIPDLEFSVKEIVKKIEIYCTENPGERIIARVYSD
ncbi:MAG: hypothetical protein KAR19_15800 [Bacteroidales bacterium]|nr:hypothetical protein [Bacteroidales bacterium]